MICHTAGLRGVECAFAGEDVIPLRRDAFGECVGLLEMVARESTGDVLYPRRQENIYALRAHEVAERSGSGGLDPSIVGQVVEGYLSCPLLPSVKDIPYLVDEVDDYDGEGTLSYGFPRTNKVLVVEAVADEGQRSIHERPGAECRAKDVHDEPLDRRNELVSLSKFQPSPMRKGGGVVMAFLHPEESVDRKGA